MSGVPARGQYWSPSRADYKLAFLIVGIPVALVLGFLAIFNLVPGSLSGKSLGNSIDGELARAEFDDAIPCDELRDEAWRCRLDNTDSSSGTGGSSEFEVTVDGNCWEAVQIKQKGKRGEPFEGCIKLIDGL